MEAQILEYVEPPVIPSVKPPLAPGEYFCVSDSVNYEIIKLDDIVSLKANGNYTQVTIRDQPRTYLVRRPLHAVAARLPTSMFFQANRHEIVNLSHIRKMEAFDRKRLSMWLSNGRVILSTKQSIQFRRTRQL